jgi:hypothetical protein
MKVLLLIAGPLLLPLALVYVAAAIAGTCLYLRRVHARAGLRSRRIHHLPHRSALS